MRLRPGISLLTKAYSHHNDLIVSDSIGATIQQKMQNPNLVSCWDEPITP